MNKNILYLLTILEAIEKIKIYTAGIQSADELLCSNDQKEFNATLNLLITIGEESKKIGEAHRNQHPEIAWNSIAGLRNELSHNYRGTDPDIIWDIVIHHLDPLKAACISIFLSIPISRESLAEILSSEFYKHIRYLAS